VRLIQVRRRLPLFASALAAAALVLPGAVGVASASPAPDRATPLAHNAGTTGAAVSFQVRNVNRSKVACHADGKTYTVNGDLFDPAGALAKATRPGAVTLYLHGLGFGQFF